MKMRISINLAGRSLEDFAAHPACEFEQMNRSEYARLGGLDGIGLVVDGRCGACEVVNFIDFDVKRKTDVVAHQFKARIGEKGENVRFASRKKIIDAQNVIPFSEKPFTQVGA
jgi:hypothetical protein